MKPIVLRGHNKPVNVVKFNFDGDLLFTASADKRVNLWYGITGERIGNFECRGAIKSIDVTWDSKYLITGSMDGSIEVWVVETGESVGALTKESHRNKFLELSYGDKMLLTLFEGFGKGSMNEIKIFDFPKLVERLATEKKEIPKADDLIIDSFSIENKLNQVSWGPLNKSIIACSNDGRLTEFALNGKILKSEKIHDEDIKSFKIAKDFSIIVTASVDGSKVVDFKDFKILRVFKQEVPMNAVAISPLFFEKNNPKYHCVMAGGIPAREAAQSKQGGFEIHLCNIMYEEEIGSISGHFGPVNCLAFYPDGRGFVSGGEEGLTRLFRFPKNYYDDKVLE